MERTAKEVRYYRGVMVSTVARRFRMTPEDVALRMKKQYFDGSTRGHSIVEFERILSKIRSDFSKKGVYIAKPNEDPQESYQ